MKRILENEINKLIGRYPTEDELNSAIKYLDGCADDLTSADEISGLLEDWRSNCLETCAGCGAYHLPDDMVLDEDSNEMFCNEECIYDWKNGYTMSELESGEYKHNVLR